MPSTIARETLHARLTTGESVALVEALGAAFYADAHLPGAINIPRGQEDRLAPLLLPDQERPIVVYCSGACTSAAAVAHRLEALGYLDVAVYAGGKEDWVEHDLPIERSDPTDGPA